MNRSAFGNVLFSTIETHHLCTLETPHQLLAVSVDLLKMVSIQPWEEAEQKILVKAILKVRDQCFQLAKSGKRHPASFERCSVFIGLVFCQSSLWTFAGNQTYECQNMLFTLLKLATSYPWKIKSTTDTHNFYFRIFPGPLDHFWNFPCFFLLGSTRWKGCCLP